MQLNPPTKFQIMRMNRGFGEFVNDKQQLLCGIDCTELQVLRTLMRGQDEERYPAAERVARELGMPLSDAMPTLPPQLPLAKPPAAPARRTAGLRRWWNFSLGLGENA